MAKRLWAGLDVSVETTTICVVDDAGKVLHEGCCPTTAKSVHRELSFLRRRRHALVCLEAATGMNLARGLRSLGYSVELYEARQLSKFLRIRRNKTDAGDAGGIADAGRLGAATVSRVHLKSLECQALQSRLAIRRHSIRQRVALLNLLGRQLELYGGRLSSTKPAELRDTVEAETRRLFGKATTPLGEALLHLVGQCESLFAYQQKVDRELKQLACENEVCKHFMEIPGVGPLCALGFYSAVGDPSRFRRSTDVASYFGLVPRIHQSGSALRIGRISKMGSTAVRTSLVHASMMFMRFADPNSPLRAWARNVEERRGRSKARIALARKLSTVMLAMWRNGEAFEPGTDSHRPIARSSLASQAPQADDRPQPGDALKEPSLAAVL